MGVTPQGGVYLMTDAASSMTFATASGWEMYTEGLGFFLVFFSDAGASVTLQAGGHWINVSADGIFSSTEVQLGGSPASAGALLTPGLQEKVLAVIAAPLSAVQVSSLKRSAPFCEECERCRNGVCDTPLHRSASLAGGAP